MDYKIFRVIKAIIAFAFAFLIAVSVVLNNVILALVAAVVLIAISFTLNHKVRGVLNDERGYANAGKAARLALSVFSLTGAILGLALMFTHYETIGSVISYSVCALLLLYSMLFSYYEKQD